MQRYLFSAYIGAIAICTPAWGQGIQDDNNSLVTSSQRIDAQFTKFVKSACPGKTPIAGFPESLDLPGAPQMQSRCIAILAFSSTCFDLATETGGLKYALNSGAETLEQIQSQTMSSTNSNLADAALYLVEQSPSNEPAGKLEESTFKTCLENIK